MAACPHRPNRRRPPVRAIVLAGGGLVGIGWEVGVLLGLRAAGAWPDAWDRIVGTSAGSVVGAALGTDDGLERLSATDWATYGHELAGYMQSLDHAAVARIDAALVRDAVWPGPGDLRRDRPDWPVRP